MVNGNYVGGMRRRLSIHFFDHDKLLKMARRGYKTVESCMENVYINANRY